jgi:putative salt-induced outer membrane protein
VIRLLVATLLLVPSFAAADRVTVKGAVLEGKVKAISSKKISMETIYGKGELTIKTSDVTAIETDVPFHVFRSDDGTEVGRVIGITPAAVTLAPAEGAPVEIAFDAVQAAPRDVGPDANWFARRGVEYPWWRSHYDFALSATESTVDSSSLALGFGAKRERGPSRLKLGATYLRATSQDDFTKRLTDDPMTPEDESLLKEDGSESITASELRGFLRQEYDLTKRVFGFGSLEAEHDGVEALSYRLIPKLGAGYKLVNREDAYLALDAGLAFVYESFYGPNHNSYAAVAFGGEHKWKLPLLGASWYSRADYLPSITDPFDDYRLRAETGLLVPLLEQLSFKASLVDDYNALPAEDTSANTLTTLLGLSLMY